MRVKPSHVILLSQSRLCIPGIATLQCRQMSEIEASYTRKDGRKKRQIAIQVEKTKGEKQRSETEKGRETDEKSGGVGYKVILKLFNC